jgi:hypothetical protein
VGTPSTHSHLLALLALCHLYLQATLWLLAAVLAVAHKIRLEQAAAVLVDCGQVLGWYLIPTQFTQSLLVLAVQAHYKQTAQKAVILRFLDSQPLAVDMGRWKAQPRQTFMVLAGMAALAAAALGAVLEALEILLQLHQAKETMLVHPQCLAVLAAAAPVLLVAMAQPQQAARAVQAQHQASQVQACLTLAVAAAAFIQLEHPVLVVLAVAVLVEQQTEITVRLELLTPEAVVVVRQVVVQHKEVAAQAALA